MSLLDFSTVDERPVPGAKISYKPAILKKDFGVPPAGAVIGDWNFVRRGAADDQRAVRFQAKNVGPSRSLTNDKVGGTIVLLHRESLEITLGIVSDGTRTLDKEDSSRFFQ
jgi:hypothetical protein